MRRRVNAALDWLASPRVSKVARTVGLGLVVVSVFSQAFALSTAINAQRDQRATATKTILSIRDGCEDTNVLRVNQALGISEQIAQTETSLKGSLGPLEPFRAQVVEGLKQRRMRLSRIALSVSDHPLTGRKARQYPEAERPYRTDCAAAYP